MLVQKISSGKRNADLATEDISTVDASRLI